MQNTSHFTLHASPNKPRRAVVKYDLAILAILLVAFFLRPYRLHATRSCLEYDEAANVILAGEIATGKSFPVFIRPYTGKEVLYFYLAAGMMKWIGVHPFALRLTSAFLGLLNVALSYWCARELLWKQDSITLRSRGFSRSMLWKQTKNLRGSSPLTGSSIGRVRTSMTL